MGMFKNYDKLSPNYVPNNSYKKEEPDYDDINKELPIVEKDFSGMPVGYSWHRGETFTLSVDLSTKIKVAWDALIFEKSGEHPDGCTKARYSGQQAYNIVDGKSWTFVGMSADLFVWVEDEELTYPMDGTKEITIKSDTSNDSVILEVYNFRWEPFHTFRIDGSNVLKCEFDKELSNKFLPGIYPCVVRMNSGDESVVKDKYVLVVK